jgi:colicin import membrane protein
MTTLATDPLRPQPPGGMGRGAMIALLVHLGLLAALAVAVRWRASEPEGVSAELWAAVPQAAAPREEPVPPAPPPPQPQPRAEPSQAQRDADIAVEKARRERQEKERLERERERAEKEKQQAEQRRQELEAQRKKVEDEKRLAKLREENLKRIQGMAGATGGPTSTGTATHDAGPSASYAGRIKARIKPHIVLLDDVPGNPMAEVEVRAAPDGTILARKLLKGSGSKDWDDAVLRAIDRTEMLPRDVDGRVPSTIVIAFRPKE